MPKKKPNNWKNLRQGQTIYWIEEFNHIIDPNIEPEIKKYFLWGKSTELPPEGCIIEKMPCHFIKNRMKKGYPVPKMYFSRRKCESALKMLINK